MSPQTISTLLQNSQYVHFHFRLLNVNVVLKKNRFKAISNNVQYVANHPTAIL